MSEIPKDIMDAALQCCAGFLTGHREIYVEDVALALLAERTRALSQLEAGKAADAVLYVHPEIFSSALVYPVREREMASKLKTTGFVPLYRSALASPSPAAEAEPVDNHDPHRYAVVSSDYNHPFLLGAYAALENATKAQGGNPDKWDIFVKVGTPTPAVDADAVIEALCTTPLIEDIVPSSSEWEQCHCLQDRNDLIKHKLRAAGRALSLPPSADKGE